MIRTSIFQNIIRSIGLPLFVVLLMGLSDVVAEEDLIGADEYRISCLSCHGVGGKGNGPMAEILKVQPSDLTVIAKNNEGVFPLDQVFRTVDGRHGVTGHGDRDMPIWGARYLRESAGKYGDFSGEGEDVVQLRILELVYYIQLLQQN